MGGSPSILNLFLFLVFKILVDMLSAIELGAPWPKGVCHGRLAYLAKDPNNAEDPLAYRPLLVLPHLYRRWAAYRLQCLPTWIRE